VVHAQSGAQTDVQAEVWATACLTCHSAPSSQAKTPIPSLYGLPAERIESQMAAYARGDKPGLLMQQLAKGYDDETLHRIAVWFQNAQEQQP
jgi:cytochrome c553